MGSVVSRLHLENLDHYYVTGLDIYIKFQCCAAYSGVKPRAVYVFCYSTVYLVLCYLKKRAESELESGLRVTWLLSQNLGSIPRTNLETQNCLKIV